MLHRLSKRRTKQGLQKPSNRRRWSTAHLSLYLPVLISSFTHQERQLRLSSPPRPPAPAASATIQPAASVSPPLPHTRTSSAARRSISSSAAARPQAFIPMDTNDVMLDDLALQQVIACIWATVFVHFATNHYFALKACQCGAALHDVCCMNRKFKL